MKNKKNYFLIVLGWILIVMGFLGFISVISGFHPNPIAGYIAYALFAIGGFFLIKYGNRKSVFKRNDINVTQFKTLTIGTQTWSSSNLNVSTFSNGDAILEAKTAVEWIRAGENGKPAWCCYENNLENVKIYGKLYNWFAVKDIRRIAPKGWHIPSDAEWTILIDNLGASAGTKMKSNYGWYRDGNGTNESGFDGLPGGLRQSNGSFNDNFRYGLWWSTTESDTHTTDALCCGLYNDDGNVGRGVNYKRIGLSVRCLMN